VPVVDENLEAIEEVEAEDDETLELDFCVSVDLELVKLVRYKDELELRLWVAVVLVGSCVVDEHEVELLEGVLDLIFDPLSEVRIEELVQKSFEGSEEIIVVDSFSKYNEDELNIGGAMINVFEVVV
jgi:hypothetical protein